MPSSDIPLYELFHENSKNDHIPADPVGQAPDSWFEIDYQTYPGADEVDISSAPADGAPMFETIDERRSPESFTGDGISARDLGTLLSFGAGITDRGSDPDAHRRAYPSGGARYPLELYACPFSVDGVEPGVYHFDVQAACLERLVAGVSPEDVAFVANDLTETTAVALFLTAAFERTTEKYGDRGYRYALMEAGHLMQNVCLVAETLDLGCRPVAGFEEDAADTFLDCPVDQTTLYVGLVGVPADQ